MGEPTLTCRFEHPAIAALGITSFRLTKGDGVAALVMNLDLAEAVVPLRAVARLLGFTPDSADGQMVGLIEKALQFVPALRLGDPLPTEVLTGEASWEPSERHIKAATARLQLQLLSWINGSEGEPDGHLIPQWLLASTDDPAFRPQVQEALCRAAAELGVEGGEAVAKLIEELAVELSYVEALRERLLERARMMVKRLERMAVETSMSARRRETLLQVVRLSSAGVAKIAGRFEDVDALTREIVPALRNLERQRGALRPHRDWLYCTLLGWEPFLPLWDAFSGSAFGDMTWKTLDEAYRFLAPRYMPVQEWQSVSAGAERTEQAKAVLVW